MNFKTVLSILLLGVVCFVSAQDSGSSSAQANSASSEIVAKTFCYVCNENTDKSCGDVYQKKKAHLKECAADETFCRKIVQYVEGERSVIRQCAKNLYKKDYEGCYKSAGKSTQHVCTCKPKSSSDQDSCNHAGKAKASVLGMGLIALVAAFFY